MEYLNFESNVNLIVGDAHYKEYKHLLPAVRQSFRDRCLHTLNLGFKIPDTLAHIAIAGHLPEKNYHRYIKYIRDNKNITAYTIV